LKVADDFPSQYLSLFSVFVGQPTLGAQLVVYPPQQVQISRFENSAAAYERHAKPPLDKLIPTLRPTELPEQRRDR
jgi:hypothetical protein